MGHRVDFFGARVPNHIVYYARIGNAAAAMQRSRQKNELAGRRDICNCTLRTRELLTIELKHSHECYLFKRNRAGTLPFSKSSVFCIRASLKNKHTAACRLPL